MDFVHNHERQALVVSGVDDPGGDVGGLRGRAFLSEMGAPGMTARRVSRRRVGHGRAGWFDGRRGGARRLPPIPTGKGRRNRKAGGQQSQAESGPSRTGWLVYFRHLLGYARNLQVRLTHQVHGDQLRAGLGTYRGATYGGGGANGITVGATSSSLVTKKTSPASDM